MYIWQRVDGTLGLSLFSKFVQYTTRISQVLGARLLLPRPSYGAIGSRMLNFVCGLWIYGWVVECLTEVLHTKLCFGFIM